MTIHHHLEEHSLLAYAAGSLPEAFNLIVAAHVSLCDQCRATVLAGETLGGAVMDDIDAVPMRSDSLAHVLDSLSAPPSATRPAARAPIPAGPTVLPRPVQDYVGGDLDAVKWRHVGMGVKQAVLPTSKQATARLLSIPAGGKMPEHSHVGTEMTLVLQGAFHDAEGYFARGDIDVADQNVTHTPVADAGADCICLIVTEAPLRFQKWLPRMVQRLVRI